MCTQDHCTFLSPYFTGEYFGTKMRRDKENTPGVCTWHITILAGKVTKYWEKYIFYIVYLQYHCTDKNLFKGTLAMPQGGRDQQHRVIIYWRKYIKVSRQPYLGKHSYASSCYSNRFFVVKASMLTVQVQVMCVRDL